MHFGNLLHGKSSSGGFAPVKPMQTPACKPQSAFSAHMVIANAGSPAPAAVAVPSPPSTGPRKEPAGSLSRGQALLAPRAPTAAGSSCPCTHVSCQASLSVPARGNRYCLEFHVERAVLGPSCRPRVPFPPKRIAPTARTAPPSASGTAMGEHRPVCLISSFSKGTDPYQGTVH